MNANITDVTELNLRGENIKIFPNPAKENISLRMEVEQKAEFSIYLSDLSGRLIKRLAINRQLPQGKHQLTFNIKDLTPGQYHISIKNEGEVVSKKVLLQN